MFKGFTAVLGVLKSSQDQANKNITKPLQYIHVTWKVKRK